MDWIHVKRFAVGFILISGISAGFIFYPYVMMAIEAVILAVLLSYLLGMMFFQ
jgi:hypothetical protein